MSPHAERRPLRVGLAGDAPLVQLGVARALRPHASHITFLGAWLPGAKRGLLAPDLVLLDPTASSAAILDVLADLPWVGFSWRPLRSTVTASLARGARGFLDKAGDGASWTAALRRIGRGERVVPTLDPGKPRYETIRVGAVDHPGGLSDREAMVVALIADGLRNDQIAATCYLSINSVKTYIRTAYRKMGVTNRAQAVRWAAENGYVPWRI